jgi:Dullard-like phosphatase family protein
VTPYDDDHMSSSNICDDEQVVANTTTPATATTHTTAAAVTLANNTKQPVTPIQPVTTSTIVTTTSTTSLKRSQRKRKGILSIFNPIIWCFSGSSSASTPQQQRNSIDDKHKSASKQQPTATPTTQGTDVDVVDVESVEVTTTTTTTTVTTTTTIPTTNQNNAEQKMRKKKKKKKSPSRHHHQYYSSSDSGGHGSRSGLSAIRGKAPKALLGPQPPHLLGRKTLVLDLDETLVHSKFEPVVGADFEIPIDIEGRQHVVFVMKRPGVDEFLEEMGKLFEVVIFTASLSKYANPLLDKLDKKGVISGRLFREHCTYVDQCYIKDMSRLGREIENVLIIDNSPACYAFQPRNAMPCTSWFDDQSDTELLQMIPWLQKLSQEKAVYETLDQWRQYFTANCQWY